MHVRAAKVSFSIQTLLLSAYLFPSSPLGAEEKVKSQRNLITHSRKKLFQRKTHTEQEFEAKYTHDIYAYTETLICSIGIRDEDTFSKV